MHTSHTPTHMQIHKPSLSFSLSLSIYIPLPIFYLSITHILSHTLSHLSYSLSLSPHTHTRTFLYLYVYITHTHTHAHTHTLSLSLYIYIYISITHIYTHAHTHMHIHTHTHTLSLSLSLSLSIYIYIYLSITHIHTHAHTHTHTHSLSLYIYISLLSIYASLLLSFSFSLTHTCTYTPFSLSFLYIIFFSPPPPPFFLFLFSFVDILISVSLEFIELFLHDHPDIAQKNLTTTQISKLIIKPETTGTNQPYINKFIGKRDPNGKLYVAPSTIFVSHAWAYPFVDVDVDAMRQYANEVSTVYFWFDLFTNDQNSVVGKDFDWFCNRFRESIKAIGKVLLVLFPWNDPVPITRVWCLFEISSTLDMPDVEFIVKLPSNQVSALEQGVRDDFNVIIKALSTIQAEKATASIPTERDQIFSIIRDSPGGLRRSISR